MMLHTNMWIVLVSLIPGGITEKLTTYFLNSGHTFRIPLQDTLPDIDCVHTNITNIIPMPSKVSLCYRMQPMRYTITKRYPREPWSTMMSFGTIRPDFKGLEEGILIGAWEDEYWFAIKNRTNKNYVWQSLGDNFMRDVQIWRHSCVSFDFDTKQVQLFENGEKRYEKISEVVQKIGETLNHVAAGCLYRSFRYLSMYGRVTDLQIFGRVLPDGVMKAITGCEKRMKGDLLSWDDTAWIRSGRQDIIKEGFDWKTIICKKVTNSYHLIPLKLSNIPNSVKSCKKYSTELAIWQNKDELSDLTKYLSSKNSMAATECQHRINELEKSVTLRVWLAAHDNEEETIWKNYYNDKVITPQPWAESRPYMNGESYNCMSLDMTIVDKDQEYGEIKEVEIKDHKCKEDFYCPVCSVEFPILKIFVRGFCKDSMFETSYLFNTDKNGELLYFGEKSSMITYSKGERKWLWYDMKDNNSIATSSSPYSTLLMGVQTVDFSNVVDDPCVQDGVVRKLKFTRCAPGTFTCNDGLCIDIDQRCDKIGQCLDKSDEVDCKIVHMKGSYEKSIAPFSFDYENNRYLINY